MTEPELNALKIAYEIYAAALSESDQHWELESWDELCQEPELLAAWQSALAVIAELTITATERQFSY